MTTQERINAIINQIGEQEFQKRLVKVIEITQTTTESPITFEQIIIYMHNVVCNLIKQNKKGE